MAESKITDKERERAKIIEKVNKDLEEYIANLKPKKYEEGWPEDRWEEEMEKHPFFMSREVKEGEELPPLVEAMQQLKYSPDMNSPDELATTYKEEGNTNVKREKYRWAVHSYTAGIEAKSEDSTINAQLYCNRALAHFKIGNFNKGFLDAKEATKLDPNYEKAYYRGALCLFRLQKFNDCVSWCESCLNLNPSNESVRELKEKAEKESAVLRDKAIEASKKEKQEQDRKAELFRSIVSRGVTLSDGVMDIHEVLPDFPLDSRVYVNGDRELVWPVFFCYPEYEVSDVVQEFNEHSIFQYHLDLMFDGDSAEWDVNKQYHSKNLQVYFKDEESIFEVESSSTLGQVLANPRYKVEKGIPSFYVTVKNSVFDKEYRKKHCCC